jgi:hypothetical protein
MNCLQTSTFSTSSESDQGWFLCMLKLDASFRQILTRFLMQTTYVILSILVSLDSTTLRMRSPLSALPANLVAHCNQPLKTITSLQGLTTNTLTATRTKILSGGDILIVASLVLKIVMTRSISGTVCFIQSWLLVTANKVIHSFSCTRCWL